MGIRHHLIVGLALAGLSLGAAASSASANELRVAPPEDIINIDPQGPHTLVSSTATAIQHVYDPLLIYQGEEPVGRLATSWSQPDPNTWVFELRQGVTFHDGSPLTSADVKASLDRLKGQKNSLAKNFRAVDEIATKGDFEITIHTEKPFGAMLRALSLAHIAPAKELAELPEDGSNPDGKIFSGTGAFKVDRFVPGERLILSANPDYWDGAPEVDSLFFRNIPETAARVTALLNDEIDLSWDFAEDTVPELKSVDGVEVETVPSVFYYFIWLQEQREPFNDIRVRKALWHAVDWNKIIADLCPETCAPGEAPIASSVFGWSPQQPYVYSPDQAKSHLAKAGLPDGFEAELLVINNARDPQIAQAAASYWKKVGVNIKLTVMEKAIWLDRLNKLDWDMIMLAHPAQTEDAQNTLGRLYYGPNKETGYQNAYLDKVIDEVATYTDAEQRKAGYDRISQIVWEEAVGIYPIDLKLVYALRDRVKGAELRGSGRPRFHKVGLD